MNNHNDDLAWENTCRRRTWARSVGLISDPPASDLAFDPADPHDLQWHWYSEIEIEEDAAEEAAIAQARTESGS